ncbi:DoxX family protein [Nonomuraea basaltis]|uniref:DoxX family protein n=1 Tax=Nonomuraea basaltis TaxID=2495887 RepID=UPI00110C6BF4|nr:DoxX family protein [Nonomuraea basaltis]TMR93733.1 DoxX family protein [Nonomuraea basaltis]
MKRVVFDVAALITRVAAGVIFLAHGLQKWQGGFGATAQGFREMGIPMPELAAGYATVVEIVGGILLIVGLLVRPVGLLLLINMLGAIAFVHAPNGILAQNNGWELPGALGSLALLFLALGGGRIGLDGLFGSLLRRRRERHAAEDELTAYRRGTPMGGTEPTTGGMATGATAGRAGGPTTPSESTTRPEPPKVPRQPAPPRSGASNLNDEDMRDIDALVADDQPEHRKPPNR